MKILVCSQTFYPDHSGIAIYASEFAFGAAKLGHEVSVVTGFPFYPAWEKRESDRGVLFRLDEEAGVSIFRGYLTVKKNPGAFARVLQELTLLMSATINFFRAGRPDVIVVFVTPISLGFLSLVFKYLYRCKLVVNVQDFQLEAAESLGMVASGVLDLVAAFETATLRNADYVTSISESMVALLESRKRLESSRVGYWPNWIDIAEASGKVTKGAFRARNKFGPNDILIAYAGNVGKKQGLEVLIDASKHFQSYENVRFLVIGAGADLQRLEDYKEKEQANNVAFLPFLNPTEYAEFLEDVDLVFISQKRTEFDVYFPSKLLGIMAREAPILLAADPSSELFRVLDINSLALTVRYEDSEGLRDSIQLFLEQGTQLTGPYVQRAYEYVCGFEREVVISGVVERLEMMVNE